MKKNIALALTVLCFFILSSCKCEHTWVAATCTHPKTCSECGETEGDVIEHSWVAATCMQPKTCSKCGETEGEPLAHNWENATCQTPKTCTDCGTTEGKLLSHTWIEATCSQPKTCTVCSVTDGDKLPHTPVKEWVTQKTNYIYAETVKVQTCSDCGEVVNRKILDVEKLHDDTFFLISPEDFITRFGNTLESYTENNYDTEGASTADSYVCGVIEDGSAVCVLIFTKHDDMVTKDQRNDSGAFNKLLGTCDPDALARVSCALIQTADPTLSLSDAKKYVEEMIKYDSVSVNGIKYILETYDDKYFIGFTIG